MWILPEEMSRIAYEICLEDDRLEIRDLITESRWAYYYCRDVKDRPEIRDNITESEYICYYCRNVEDRPEMRARITNEEYLKEVELEN